MIDEVIVPLDLFRLAKTSDSAPLRAWIESLGPISLYDHIFIPPKEWGECAPVTLQELDDLDVVNAVTVNDDYAATRRLLARAYLAADNAASVREIIGAALDLSRACDSPMAMAERIANG